jgi:hypothetical protein
VNMGGDQLSKIVVPLVNSAVLRKDTYHLGG